MLTIDYESEGFPLGAPVTNGRSSLNTDWDELLRAALTVGRPSRHHVFQHGLASTYEALFRLSLVRMAVEQSGPTARRLRRTAAARSLDPSEKGAVNYFLGMAMCKLFSSSLLDAPWMLHLDVFRPLLNPVLNGRSRPDLIGQTRSGDWLAFESKGRVSPPGADAKTKAKAQSQRCVSVNGVPVTFQIGGIMYFRKDVLQFFWRDPPPNEPENAIPITVQNDTWRHYYGATFEIIRGDADGFAQMLQQPFLLPIAAADVQIGIYPDVLQLLAKELWGEAKEWCVRNFADLEQQGYRADGIRVIAGSSWLSPLLEVPR